MEAKLTDILDQMVLLKASDCYLKVGEKPSFRVNGTIRRSKFNEPADQDMEAYINAVMTDFQRERFQEAPDLDLAHNTEGGNRFRINVFRLCTSLYSFL